MNDMTQAPNFAFSALVARLHRINDDVYLSHDEKAALMYQTALQTPSVVHDVVLRTQRVDNRGEKTEANPEGWEQAPYEDWDEQLLVELHDGRFYAFSLGHPDR
jgi:hypothetical protein